MQVWWLFTIKFLIFLSICRFCALLASKCWSFLSICRFGELQFLKPAYTQKKSIKLIVKSHQTCIYSKKSKTHKNFRLYVGLTGIDELVFDIFDFFEYMQVWWLFTIKILFFLSICRFCALLASKCWFFLSICRFGELQFLKPTCLQPSNDMILFNLFSSFNIYPIIFKGKTN